MCPKAIILDNSTDKFFNVVYVLYPDHEYHRYACWIVDFKVERTALLKDTFPTLQHHCLKYGIDLHWVDVHHGCQIDHAKDTHSFQRHLATMEECHRKSSGPFFIVCMIP